MPPAAGMGHRFGLARTASSSLRGCCFGCGAFTLASLVVVAAALAMVAVTVGGGGSGGGGGWWGWHRAAPPLTGAGARQGAETARALSEATAEWARAAAEWASEVVDDPGAFWPVWNEVDAEAIREAFSKRKRWRWGARARWSVWSVVGSFLGAVVWFMAMGVGVGLVAAAVMAARRVGEWTALRRFAHERWAEVSALPLRVMLVAVLVRRPFHVRVSAQDEKLRFFLPQPLAPLVSVAWRQRGSRSYVVLSSPERELAVVELHHDVDPDGLHAEWSDHVLLLTARASSAPPADVPVPVATHVVAM